MKDLDLVNFLFEVGTLRKIMRAHRQSFLTDDLTDNISSHSFRVAIIGYFLAKKERVDESRVLLMCLFHDMAESRSGDQNWVHKRYVKVYEDEITKDQFEGLDKNLYEVMREYSERKTKESIVAKDADRLDQFLLVKEYQLLGNQEANKWIGESAEKEFKTKSAKKLFREIYSSNPSNWWKKLWVSARR